MRDRAAMVFVAGMLCGALVLGGGYLAIDALTDDAQAQNTGTWQVAGPPDGFSAYDYGAGLGPEQSLDDWIRQLPASCDIEILERGVSFTTILYRCP